MAKHRFFVSPFQLTDSVVHIVGEDAHQIRVVLRLRPGDEIAVLDGSGKEYLCTLETVRDGEVRASVHGSRCLHMEPKVFITVVQALAKGEKVDRVIQHGTEIGVSRFLLVDTTRSVLHLDGDREERRLERWRRVAKEAAEQAHRAKIPEVRGVLSLPEALQLLGEAKSAVLHPESAGQSMLQWLRDTDMPRGFAVIVGPEGGFTREEIEVCEHYGAAAVSLMPRVLRTETAALVAVSQILLLEALYGGQG